MLTSFPQLRVGEPMTHNGLSVFPLFGESSSGVDYVLGADAIAQGSVVVEEISEAGSVPKLSVTNRSEKLILFLEGEQLIGAKQNRILNTSILVGANCRTTIPVSCVEQGRWRAESTHFQPAPSHSPSELRYSLKKSVSESMKAGFGYDSDQASIWSVVRKHLSELKVASPTSAMSDSMACHRREVESATDRLVYVPGATGIAVAIGGRVVSLDVFDKPATCERVWTRLLNGAALEAMSAEAGGTPVRSEEVKAFVATLEKSPWASVPAPGQGDEYRCQTGTGAEASALCYDAQMIHGSAVCQATG